MTDEKLSSAMLKIAGTTRNISKSAPWDAQYKQQVTKPPVAKAVETIVETGDFHVTTIGDNLPNESEVHEKFGTKSFLFTGSSRAFDEAIGTKVIEEFGDSAESIERDKKYGVEAWDC